MSTAASAQDILALETSGTIPAPVPILTLLASAEARVGRLASSSAQLLPIEASGSQIDTGLHLTSQLAVPLPAAMSQAVTSRFAVSSQPIPGLDLVGKGITQRLASSSQVAPTLLASGMAVSAAAGETGVYSHINVPALDAHGAAITARTASTSQALPLFEVVSLVAGAPGLTSRQHLPLLQAQGSVVTGRIGLSTLTLPSPVATGQGNQSRMVASELELPMLNAAGFLGLGRSGASLLVLPSLVVSSWGNTNTAPPLSGTAAQLGKTYAMHTQNTTVTEYQNHGFNSYAVVGSVVLAANEDGLFVLGGSTDNGTAIAGMLQLELSDMDEPKLRRMANMVLGYRTDGRMLLTVSTDDGASYSYVLENVAGTTCKPNRVKIGRGMRSRYFSIKAENRSGSDFAIDKLDVDWETLSRRVP